MNFLAHIYLSGADPLVQLGNFMADSIKGKQWQAYEGGVLKGIQMHRFIDSYTDAHSIFRQTTQLFHPQLHHYAGVAVDMVYDHYLARDFHQYHSLPLAEFAENFYRQLEINAALLPENIQRFAPYMIEQNWLVAYAQLDGWANIMRQMARRGTHTHVLLHARQVLEANYTRIEQQFCEFFTDIQQAIQSEFGVGYPDKPM